MCILCDFFVAENLQALLVVRKSAADVPNKGWRWCVQSSHRGKMESFLSGTSLAHTIVCAFENALCWSSTRSTHTTASVRGSVLRPCSPVTIKPLLFDFLWSELFVSPICLASFIVTSSAKWLILCRLSACEQIAPHWEQTFRQCRGCAQNCDWLAAMRVRPWYRIRSSALSPRTFTRMVRMSWGFVQLDQNTPMCWTADFSAFQTKQPRMILWFCVISGLKNKSKKALAAWLICGSGIGSIFYLWILLVVPDIARLCTFCHTSTKLAKFGLKMSATLKEHKALFTSFCAPLTESSKIIDDHDMRPTRESLLSTRTMPLFHHPWPHETPPVNRL